MKNGAALAYLGIILTALLLFVLFDNNASSQEEKADEATRESRINMLNSECRENIRLCNGAMDLKTGLEVRVRALKTFMNYAEKHAIFGAESAALWQAALESARMARLTDTASGMVKVKKDDVEKTAAVFTALKVFVDKAIDNGYNFEF